MTEKDLHRNMPPVLYHSHVASSLLTGDTDSATDTVFPNVRRTTCLVQSNGWSVMISDRGQWWLPSVCRAVPPGVKEALVLRGL